MTLYSADVLDIAKPIASTKKGKKQPATESAVEEPEAVEVKKEEVEEKPAKRIPTEKQLAALARAQEARKRKRDEMEAAAAEQKRLEEELATKAREKAEAAEAKKEAMKLKRKLTREAKKQVATPPATESSVGSLEEEIEAGIREPAAKKARTEDGPPVWFKQYVAGVKKEEAKVSKDKKPQRQIKQEAIDVAEHQWNDGFTRDRVRNEVDNHMSRMYQMMFSGRRLK